MSPIARLKNRGVSLRSIHTCLIIVALVVSFLLIYSTFHSNATFQLLSDATDDYIELQEAAHELMDASDYLTEKVQRFTLTGERHYLDAYFQEAFETRRREDAICKLSRDPDSSTALEKLQGAMDESEALMETEYYAMMLVIRALSYTDYPLPLQSVELNAEDEALSSEEKIALAQSKVLGTDYFDAKERIRKNMKASMDELNRITHQAQRMAASELKLELLIVRAIIVFQALGIMFMIWLTTRLGINPVLKAVDNIRGDSPIPVIGANEFRYLAQTYNKMYEVYKKSVAHLNYVASHDELTNLYNRAGYDLLLESLDLSTTYLILIDADHFKTINDTYGHETGDKILCKIAASITHNFRSDDYACRIGGDEFVVFMVHASQEQSQLIRYKIRQINEELADTRDGLPPISISAGVAHGSELSEDGDLFDLADQALYHTKRTGRKGYTFYSAMN